MSVCKNSHCCICFKHSEIWGNITFSRWPYFVYTYTEPLKKITSKSLKFHFYADNSQIYCHVTRTPSQEVPEPDQIVDELKQSQAMQKSSELLLQNQSGTWVSHSTVTSTSKSRWMLFAGHNLLDFTIWGGLGSTY